MSGLGAERLVPNRPRNKQKTAGTTVLSTRWTRGARKSWSICVELPCAVRDGFLSAFAHCV